MYTPSSYHLGILKLLEGISFQSFKMTILSSNLDLARKSKGVSDLKTWLDYYGDPTRNFENLNFYLPAQTKLFYWLRNQCSQPKLFLAFAWFFSSACNLGQMGRKFQMFATSSRIFTIIYPHFINTYLWLLEEKKDS